MHEVSIVSDMLNIVYENVQLHNMKSINKIVIKVGEFTCINESSLRFAYECLCKNTICENTKLEIKKIKASAYCDNCSKIFSISYTNRVCPICNKFSKNVVTGDELTVDSIEGEQK